MTKKRILLIDALISIAVVLVGFNAINHFGQSPRNEMLLRSGVVTMTSDELIKHVRNEKIVAYWFGPL